MKALFLTLLALAACQAFAGESPANIPIDNWSEKDPGTRIRWETRISPPELSPHQRLKIVFHVQVDGVELAKRQGKGNLLMLVQLRDKAGHVYQDSNSISLANVSSEISGSDTVYSQEAFLVPGDYQVSMGALFDNTSEHVVQRRTLRVEALRHDPIPEAWRDLPAVEFIPSLDLQDSWYLPALTGRLNLPVASKRPVRVDLLVNGSLTEEVQVLRRPASRGRVNIEQLIPAVKVLSQIKLSPGSLRIAMLDLERRRVSFQQTLNEDLDWGGLKGALVKADPNKIDVASLEKSEQNAQFFVSEIRHRVAALEGEPHVLIVLSGPMAFGKANLKPIEAVADPSCKIFYIRYHAPIRRDLLRSLTEEGAENTRRPNRRGGDFKFPTSGPLPSDQLFGLIKSLDPRLFDVTTPEEFRKSLATILSEIARLSS